jgi:hypothetical protein
MCSVSSYGVFNPGEGNPSAHLMVACVGPISCLNDLEQVKYLAREEKRTIAPPSSSLET